jgi:hypothetical protein
MASSSTCQTISATLETVEKNSPGPGLQLHKETAPQMNESETRNLNSVHSRRAFVPTSTVAAISLLSACNQKTDESKQAEIPATSQETPIVALTRKRAIR